MEEFPFPMGRISCVKDFLVGSSSQLEGVSGGKVFLVGMEGVPGGKDKGFPGGKEFLVGRISWREEVPGGKDFLVGRIS